MIGHEGHEGSYGGHGGRGSANFKAGKKKKGKVPAAEGHLSPESLARSGRAHTGAPPACKLPPDIESVLESVPAIDQAPVKDLLRLMNSHRALLKALQIPSYTNAEGHHSNLFNEMAKYVKYMWQKKSDLEAVIDAGKVEREQTAIKMEQHRQCMEGLQAEANKVGDAAHGLRLVLESKNADAAALAAQDASFINTSIGGGASSADWVLVGIDAVLRQFDKDGDGVLNGREVGQLRTQLGHNDYATNLLLKIGGYSSRSALDASMPSLNRSGYGLPSPPSTPSSPHPALVLGIPDLKQLCALAGTKLGADGDDERGDDERGDAEDYSAVDGSVTIGGHRVASSTRPTNRAGLTATNLHLIYTHVWGLSQLAEDLKLLGLPIGPGPAQPPLAIMSHARERLVEAQRELKAAQKVRVVYQVDLEEEQRRNTLLEQTIAAQQAEIESLTSILSGSQREARTTGRNLEDVHGQLLQARSDLQAAHAQIAANQSALVDMKGLLEQKMAEKEQIQRDLWAAEGQLHSMTGSVGRKQQQLWRKSVEKQEAEKTSRILYLKSERGRRSLQGVLEQSQHRAHGDQSVNISAGSGAGVGAGAGVMGAGAFERGIGTGTGIGTGIGTGMSVGPPPPRGDGSGGSLGFGGFEAAAEPTAAATTGLGTAASAEDDAVRLTEGSMSLLNLTAINIEADADSNHHNMHSTSAVSQSFQQQHRRDLPIPPSSVSQKARVGDRSLSPKFANMPGRSPYS